MTQFFLTGVSPSVVTFAVDLKTPDADVLTEGLTATEGDGASALAPCPERNRREPPSTPAASRRGSRNWTGTREADRSWGGADS